MEHDSRMLWNAAASPTARTAVVLAAFAALALAILGGAYFATGAGDNYPDPIAQLSR